jgi:hypothetical protein
MNFLPRNAVLTTAALLCSQTDSQKPRSLARPPLQMRNSEYSPPQPHARARLRAKCKSAAREGLARKRLHLASENSGHGTCLWAGSLATLGAGAGIVLAPAMNTLVQCAACPTPQGGRHNSIPIILVRTALPPFSLVSVCNFALWPDCGYC